MALYGATIGKLGIFQFEAATNQACANVLPKQDLVETKYLFYYLLAERDAFINLGQGGAQPNISQGIVREHPFPLAPLAEQRRIVTKVEALLAKVNANQERLERIPTILKRFRQAVLAAACDGRLTEEWRGQNPQVQSALDLLGIIRSARQAQATTGRRSQIAAVSILELVGESRPDDPIPASWVWVRFGDLIGELRNGISTRPEMGPPGVPILRISAVRGGSVDLDEIRYLLTGEEHLPVSALKDGDLLFTRYNGSLELLGVCGMVRGIAERTVLYPDKLMRVRFDHEAVSPPFTEIFFQVPKVHERITERSKSSAGQNGVSGSDIKDQPFTLPPLKEQQEIVRRVDELFAFADQIEARYTKAKAQVDRLTQSILAKAFRGELVPQDPNDEPAASLLERMKSCSAIDLSPSKRRGRPAKPKG